MVPLTNPVTVEEETKTKYMGGMERHFMADGSPFGAQANPYSDGQIDYSTISKTAIDQPFCITRPRFSHSSRE